MSFDELQAELGLTELVMSERREFATLAGWREKHPPKEVEMLKSQNAGENTLWKIK
jgi:hypothetical protein